MKKIWEFLNKDQFSILNIIEGFIVIHYLGLKGILLLIFVVYPLVLIWYSLTQKK